MSKDTSLNKKMFADVSDSDDGDFSAASDDAAVAPAPAAPAADARQTIPETKARHVDPAEGADEEEKAFDSARKKERTKPSRASAAGKPQAARYPSEEPAPLVRHIQAATPHSKTKRAAPTSTSTPATASKPVAARHREEVEAQEMDPRGVQIELKGPNTAENSLVKRRAGSGAVPASSTSRAAAAKYAHNKHDDSDGEDDAKNLSTGSSSSDEDCHVADYVFPRMEADLINHDKHTAKASRGTVKPPNGVEFFLATMLTIDMRVALYFVTLFLCLVLTVVSIPTSQIDGPNKSCYTFYGFKDNCDAAVYTVPVSLMPCSARATRLQAGAAFSIIALVIYLVNFVMAFIVIFCLRDAPHKVSLKSRIVLGAVGGVNVIIHLIPWACIAGIYSSRYCETSEVRETAYGVGFGLSLTAWLLNLLCVVALLAVPNKVVKALRGGH